MLLFFPPSPKIFCAAPWKMIVSFIKRFIVGYKPVDAERLLFI